MILKKKDGRESDIAELKRLLALKLSSKQRFLIEREIKCIGSGERNEQNSAYYLDFRFKDSPNWVVIHDLRLDLKGRVAQIDHLVINRFMDVFVLESKSYYYGVKVTERGEFLLSNGKYDQAIESPYEQNLRHIQVLQQVVDERNLAPTRLGFSIPACYRNVILIAPTSNLKLSKQAPFDLSTVIKADSFVSLADKMIDEKSVVGSAKLIGTDALQEFGQKLVRLHRPGTIDYAAKFGTKEHTAAVDAEIVVKESPAPQFAGAASCQECGVEVDKKVVYFCRINKTKFNGQVLCRECQQIPAI